MASRKGTKGSLGRPILTLSPPPAPISGGALLGFASQSLFFNLTFYSPGDTNIIGTRYQYQVTPGKGNLPVTLAPLLPNGSLTTWTIISSPTLSSFSIRRTGRVRLLIIIRVNVINIRKAFFSSPISTNPPAFQGGRGDNPLVEVTDNTLFQRSLDIELYQLAIFENGTRVARLSQLTKFSYPSRVSPLPERDQ